MQNPTFPLRARPKDSIDKACSNESLFWWHLECQKLIETTNSETKFTFLKQKFSVLFFGLRPPLLLAAKNELPIKVAKKRSVQQCTHLGQNRKSCKHFFWFYVKASIKKFTVKTWMDELNWNDKIDVKSPIQMKHALQIFLQSDFWSHTILIS